MGIHDDAIYNLHPKWRVPREEISCPECGRVYGHHRTKVHAESEMCGPCAKEDGQDVSAKNMVDADTFIEKIISEL